MIIKIYCLFMLTWFIISTVFDILKELRSIKTTEAAFVSSLSIFACIALSVPFYFVIGDGLLW